MGPCVKVIGADFELANAIETDGRYGRNVADAARLLLAQIPGYPRTTYWAGTTIEWGRRFLAGNGGSAYIDSDHLEINLPEHLHAADHAAHVHAGLRIARLAQEQASAQLDDGERLNVLASVSDGQKSWGHHLNIMVRRRLFDDLFGRKPHLTGFLATHLATATLYTGQGQVGAGNGRAACDFQLAQRPDWFETLTGIQTTHHRPLLNTRDEPHAGSEFARMHIIFFDNVLCPIANYLKGGTTQLVLAMLEAGWIDPMLALDDPLAACWEVSRDWTLKQPLALVGRGRKASAVEVQQRLAELAGEFVASGAAGDSVAGAEDILACWRQTLDWLARRDLAALARRCDWALKFLLLDRQRGRHGLTWRSPEVKCLDLRYASLDPRDGLFLQLSAAGHVEAMPSAERIERFMSEPPDETRAYLRVHLLRRFGEDVMDMDWDRIRFRVETDHYWSPGLWLGMRDPCAWGRESSEELFAHCSSLRELIESVGGLPRESLIPSGGWGGGAWGGSPYYYSPYSGW
ncbi:MAG TPA: proteasome accessory factor PafA2 family protein [Gemmataceae bacterium]|jgi:proteasome accessory factor A